MHYDPYTGTYYTYNSYSGTYVFHSQVDPSYIQDTNGGPTTASTQDYHKSQTHQDSDAQNDRDSFKDYREPEAETNTASATTPSKKNKKRKNKAKKVN